jgi:hypothetical protein
MITQTRLKALLSYNLETGLFVWLQQRHSRYPIGSQAGISETRVPGYGYVIISLDGVPYKAHRLAWLYVHGEMPAAIVDHINRDKTDNRIANLRLATRSENARNIGRRRDNTSGITGVVFLPKTNRWAAKLTINSWSRFLGSFATKEEAIAARLKAEKELLPSNNS